jgi:hypothetical protein
MPNAVNPDHYKRLDPEPIVVIENWKLGFCTGNAVKYLARAGRKEGASASDDLQKARWYVDRALEQFGIASAPEPVTDIKGLVDELELERAEAKRWKVVAMALADRLRELDAEAPKSL